MNGVKRKELKDMFQSIADLMEKEKEELGELDSLMGDGDLGLTMSRGYGSLPGIMEDLDEPDIGKAIGKAGMKMSSKIPSTMGFLMGAGLMSGGKAIGGRTAIDGEAYRDFLTGFCEGIIKRGKCQPGDRTVLDAFDSAARYVSDFLKEEPEAGFLEVAYKAEEGALAGVEATKNMAPKFGKAAVHKAAAAGVPDQGALAGFYVIQGIRIFAEKRRGDKKDAQGDS